MFYAIFCHVNRLGKSLLLFSVLIDLDPNGLSVDRVFHFILFGKYLVKYFPYDPFQRINVCSKKQGWQRQKQTSNKCLSFVYINIFDYYYIWEKILTLIKSLNQSKCLC